MGPRKRLTATECDAIAAAAAQRYKQGETWAEIATDYDLSPAYVRRLTCEVTIFIEQDPEVCAPRGLLSTRAIRWAISQHRREGATVQGLAR